MPKKRFTSEEIIRKLREAEVTSAQGRTVAEISVDRWELRSRFFAAGAGYIGLRRWIKQCAGTEIPAIRLCRLVCEYAGWNHSRIGAMGVLWGLPDWKLRGGGVTCIDS
jgi:hypothetical protein